MDRYDSFIKNAPEGEDKIWKKFWDLIKEYEAYKTNYVRHIEFDPNSETLSMLNFILIN